MVTFSQKSKISSLFGTSKRCIIPFLHSFLNLEIQASVSFNNISKLDLTSNNLLSIDSNDNLFISSHSKVFKHKSICESISRFTF